MDMTTTDHWRVDPLWKGEQCFILCGGPSVLDLDLTRLRGRRVIAVNSSCFTYPDADYLVFADKHWWTKWRECVIREFRGRVVALSPMGRGDHYVLVQRARVSGLTPDRRFLAVWHTTATAATNLAVHLGVSEIGYLGLDGTDRDGRHWHHEPHPDQWPHNSKRYTYHREAMEFVAEALGALGVRAFNCYDQAAHKMFPYRSFEEMTS